MKLFYSMLLVLVISLTTNAQEIKVNNYRAICIDPEVYSFFVVNPDNDSLYFIHYIPSDILDQFKASDEFGLRMNGVPFQTCSIAEIYENQTDLSFKSGKTFVYNYAIFKVGSAKEFVKAKAIPFEMILQSHEKELKDFQIGMYMLNDDEMYFYIGNKWVRK
jgi:hypothetical protein